MTLESGRLPAPGIPGLTSPHPPRPGLGGPATGGATRRGLSFGRRRREGAYYWSEYFGFRFSRNARIPSLASFVIVRSALFACESL